MKKKEFSVLIVEDEPATAMNLKTRLLINGHTVTGIAATGEEAFQITRNERPDIVLLDISLAGKASGIDVARRLKKQLPETSFAFLTATDDPDIHSEIQSLQPAATIRKPIKEKLSIRIGDGLLIL
ncbi:response regulator [Spirochaeta dissipatitropha]